MLSTSISPFSSGKPPLGALACACALLTFALAAQPAKADPICSDVAVSDKIELKDDSVLDAISGTAIVSTNSTGNDKIKLKKKSVATADLYVGVGGSTSTGIKIEGSATHNGSQGVLDLAASITSPSAPNPACGSTSGGDCSLCGDLKYDDENVTISADMRVCKFEAKGDSVITINGDVSIVVDDDFKFKDDAELRLSSGATLTIYSTEKKLSFDKDVRFNANTADPSRVTLYQLSSDKIEIKGDAVVYATAIGPDAELKIKDKGVFYGSYRGKKLKLEKKGQFHVDTSICSPSATIDHFAIAHDGGALNCQPESVTLSAHDVNHNVDSGYQSTVWLTTSTAHGDWSLLSGSGTLTNSGAGNATYSFHSSDGGQVVLGLSDSFSETVNIDVSGDGAVEDAAEDANLSFAASGFIFLADGSQSAIGTQIGGKASNVAPGVQLLELQAVRSSDSTGACESFLTNTVTLGMAFECENPSLCSANRVSINATIVPGNDAGSPLSYTNVGLDFGDASDTTAAFTFYYPDVGQIRLHALLALQPSGEVLAGASNRFVVRPFAFDITVAGNTAPTDESGAVLAAAGSAFTASARAVLWSAADDANGDGIADGHDDANPLNNANLGDNAAALNFGQEGEAVALGATLFAPNAGNDPGLAGGTTIASFASGSGSTASASYGEVGIIELSSSVADGDYAGAGTGPAGKIVGRSGPVGRFTPYGFATAYNAPSFNDGCAVGAFTYLDQPFDYNTPPVLTLTAVSASGSTTQNYAGPWWKLDNTTLANRGYSVASGNLDTSGLPLASGDPVVISTGNGTGTLTFGSGTGLVFARSATPVAPFDAEISLEIDVLDSDAVAFAGNPAKFGAAVSGGGIDFAGSKRMRYGRLALANAHGSELARLSVPLRAEYFSGTAFTPNSDDSCSNISQAQLALSKSPPGIASTATIDNQPLLLGDGALWLSPAGSGNAGTVELLLDLSAASGADLEWLRFDWPGDGSSGGPPVEDPSSRVTFGIFKGRDPIIYMREAY